LRREKYGGANRGNGYEKNDGRQYKQQRASQNNTNHQIEGMRDHVLPRSIVAQWGMADRKKRPALRSPLTCVGF
jgi:hypothetical protein